jgi:hypothetical protein
MWCEQLERVIRDASKPSAGTSAAWILLALILLLILSPGGKKQ